MLRVLHRYPFRLSIASDRSYRPGHQLIHDKDPETLNPSVSDVTVSYLVGSCGLSPTAALSVAKKFTFKTTTAVANADSLLSLLKSHGCTQSQIVKIVTTCPPLLTYNPEKNIKPKMEFFLNHGYSRADLVKLISTDPYILRASLERKISPNFNMLKSILGTDREVATSIRNSSRVLQLNFDRCMLPNLKTLRDLGVPEHRIVKFVTLYPRSLLESPARFNKAVDLIKEMGFDISKAVFTLGVNVLSILCQATWNRKLNLYRSLGFSDEDISTAFKKHPFFMLLSDEKIKQTFSFFAEELKWTPSYVAARPDFLFRSFEKTISPRYKIFRMLESKGLIKRNAKFSSFLWVSWTRFLNQYVIKYADQVPELLELYERREVGLV